MKQMFVIVFAGVSGACAWLALEGSSAFVMPAVFAFIVAFDCMER